jgi:hypothetical protein
MITLRNKSVNVPRDVLINYLRANLELHKAQFQEAVEVYQKRLQFELQEALDVVAGQINFDALSKVRVSFNPPQSHESDYVEILEMMEMSVDDTINLDSESFRAYIKNEWSWSAGLTNLIEANKVYLSSKLS